MESPVLEELVLTHGLEIAVDALIKHGRPHAAIRCLRKMRYDKQPIDSSQGAAALLAALRSSETHATDAHELAELIKVLQEDPRTDPDTLFSIEWAYLSILDRHTKTPPRLLERRLADQSAFFCEAIRLVFRSKDRNGSIDLARHSCGGFGEPLRQPALGRAVGRARAHADDGAAHAEFV